MSWKEGQAPLEGCYCPWEWNNVQWAPAQLMGLGLLFIKDRSLYSRNGKSYFCTNKNSAPIVAVIGKLSHYGKVFTGKDWMVSKLHLLSFCSDGTHVAVGLCVSSLNPFPWHPSGAAGTGSALPFAAARSGLAPPFWPGNHHLGSHFPPRTLGWCRVCLGAARLVECGIRQQQEHRA